MQATAQDYAIWVKRCSQRLVELEPGIEPIADDIAGGLSCTQFQLHPRTVADQYTKSRASSFGLPEHGNS
jgi:hypothetical protein